MDTKSFAIVDVFSTTPFKGNPLAIVEDLDEDLNDTQMKLITRQLNLSETTFFSRPSSGTADYKLRSFLPDGKEVLGIGHNILGAWWHIAHAGLLDRSSPHAVDKETGTESFQFHQELGKVVTPVSVSRQKSSYGSGPDITVSIPQARPQAHAIHPDPAALAAAFGLSPGDIQFQNLPPQVMSTSTTHHLLVPVASVEALNRAVVHRDRLLEQLKAVDDKAYGLYLFTPVSEKSIQGVPTFQARFFSPGMSTEDPATGSAAGPLASYLAKHRYIRLDGGSENIQVRQGAMVGRDCVIEVIVRGVGEEEFDTELVAAGVPIADGRIAVPNQNTLF